MWLPCVVRVKDGPIVHEVEVQAETVYEAAALGLRELKQNEWAQESADEAVVIEVEIQRPPVRHSVRLESFRAWMESSGPPKSQIERQRIKRILEGK